MKMEIKICVGSSCHIKGSAEIVDLLTKALEKHGLDGCVSLVGSFCTGQCNREGVTVRVDDEVHTGVTCENFEAFFEEKILSAFSQTKE